MTKSIKKAGSKLPSEAPNVFEEIVNELIDAWEIKDAPEIMVVNRMVATWMKMGKVEDFLKTQDLFFEQRDEYGVVTGVKINQLAQYLRTLEQEFRNYYKVLSAKMGKINAKSPETQDFLSFINAKKVSDSGDKSKD